MTSQISIFIQKLHHHYYECNNSLHTDNEDPVISGTLSDQNVNTDAGAATATVTWTPPTASDNSGTVTLSSTHNSGDMFPVGVTTVSYTAFDPDVNQVTVSFTVTVSGKL